MPDYSYIAVDQFNNIKRGTINSFSLEQIRKKFAIQGWKLISCEEKQTKNSGWNLDVGNLLKGFLKPHATAVEKISFSRHLGVMLKAGVPVMEAVESLASKNATPQFKKTINDLLLSLETGKPLSSVIEKSRFFSPAHLAILKSGEASGKVTEALEIISADLKRDYQLKKKISGAMAYPLIITLALIAVSGFVIIFVLPKVGEVFKQMRLKIPLPTRILLALGNFCKNNLSLIVAFFFLSAFGLFILSKMTRFLSQVGSFLIIRLPVIKGIVKQLEMSRFIRSLSSLLASGVPISQSLDISAKVFVNQNSQKIISQISHKLKKGVSLTNCLQEQEQLFGSTLIKMVSVGEKSGKLAEILEELALFYEDEVKSKLENFSTIIEPILMLAVGLGVGAMILSIIGPIYQMMGSLSS